MALLQPIRLLAGLTAPTNKALNRLEAEWSPASPPDTVAASILAKAFIAGLDSLSDSQIASIGSTVEGIFVSADERARGAIATGFLEALLA